MNAFLSLLYLPFTMMGWSLEVIWSILGIVITYLSAFMVFYVGVLLALGIAIILLSMYVAVTSHPD